MAFNSTFEAVETIEVEVYNSAAKYLESDLLLYRESVIHQMDLRALPAGVYYLSFLYGGNEQVVKKVVIF